MRPFKLTVLTEQILDSSAGLTGQLKSFLRPARYLLQGRKKPEQKKYGGHYAVTRSLIEGLQKTGIDFNYNPADENDVAANVIVLAGIGVLQKAIELKKRGKIEKLLAGPNICESPKEENGLLANKEIDSCIVPSRWVAAFYVEENNGLRDRIEVWHAGVDTGYWQPSSKKKQNDVIIYWKTEAEEFCAAIERIIRQYNYNPIRMKYGNYTLQQYKDALDTAEFAVFISRSESQGIALAEAWSMNVPAYVWDPGKFIYNSREYSGITSCPYLTAETGRRWIELNELESIVEKTGTGAYSFEPRNYILQSFSDEQCASDLVKKFQ